MATVPGSSTPQGQHTRLAIWDGLARVPPFSEDAEAGRAPAAVAGLRRVIAGANGLLIATPKYNGSIPGQLRTPWTGHPACAAPSWKASPPLRDVTDVAVRAALDLSSPGAPVPCVVDLRHLGGAMARQPAVPHAVGHRNARYILRLVTPLRATGISAARQARQQVFETLQPWATGRCASFMYAEQTTPGQVRTFYDPEDYERLTQLKASYDPANMFRANPLIPHTSEPAA